MELSELRADQEQALVVAAWLADVVYFLAEAFAAALVAVEAAAEV